MSNSDNYRENNCSDHGATDSSNLIYFKPKIKIPPLFIKLIIFPKEAQLLMESLNNQVEYYERLALSKDADDQKLLDSQEDLYFALLITRNKILNDLNKAAINYTWDNIQHLVLKIHLYEIFYLLSALAAQADILHYKGQIEKAIQLKSIIERIKSNLPKDKKLIKDFHQNNSIEYKKNLLLEVWNKYYSSRELN